MKKLFFLLCSLSFLFANAQDTTSVDRCGTDLNRQFILLKQRSFKQTYTFREALTTFSGIIVIPIVVHVVHNNADGSIDGTNISDDRILSQVKVLNEDYRRKAGTYGFNTNPVGADIEIEFQLARIDPNCNPTNGITRHYTTTTSFDAFSSEIKQFEPWPGNEYLNIWVGNIADRVLGFAQYPNYTGLPGLPDFGGDFSTDGIVVKYSTFGTHTPVSLNDLYYLGRTTTHEIGHWLGLLHTFGDSGCPNTDYCDDTPYTRDADTGSDCRQVVSVCDELSSIAMIENYLDYSPDICMNIFTLDQKARMWQTMTTSPDRVNILNFMSDGVNTKCIAPSLTAFPITENFEKQDSNTAPVSANCSGTRAQIIPANSGSSNYFYSTGLIDNTSGATYTLSFDYAYPNSELSDTLFLYGYTGCKTGRYLIGSIIGNNLFSSTNSGTNFEPQCNDWSSKKIIFTSSYSYFNLQFQTNQNLANNLFIDNIRLETSEVFPKYVPTLQVKTLGNPITDNKLKLEVLFSTASDIEFELVDLLGQKVFVKTEIKALPGVFELDIPDLSSGIFIVKTKVNNEIALRKILIH